MLEYVLAGVEEGQPGDYRQQRQEELSCNRYYQGGHKQCCNGDFRKRTETLLDAKGEDAKESEDEVLGIIEGPLVCTEGS